MRNLKFCFLCGADFTPDDLTDHDHVPPEAIFAKQDRDPLKLRSHKSCNHAHHLNDEKIGQLVSLRRRSPSKGPERLDLRLMNIGTAIWKLDVDGAVWRWVSGFHAALYKEPLRYCPTGLPDPPYVRSLVLPFPRGSKETRRLEPLRDQHYHFVGTIKENRFLKNLDRIECNNGKLVYECVWTRYDQTDHWFCAFALDIYDWKDLGAITPKHARGAVGHYMLETRAPPANATTARKSSLILPNYDKADPFAP